MLSATGIVSVDKESERIVVDLSDDFIDYYNWFITKRYWVKFQKPMHGSHITIANKMFQHSVDWEDANFYHGEELSFEYDPYIVEGGYTKNFIMYYIKVFSPDIDFIKYDLGIEEKLDYKGLHITLAHQKKGEPKMYWPEMIPIKN
jgi:hypothetical protein